jgi:ectoine hydroxylase-related dioxygenase (phytanoyl-CoA dioxygenase family)
MNFLKIREELMLDGVALIPNLIKGDDLSLVKNAIQFARNYPSPFGREIKNGESIFFHDFWTYRRNKSVGKILGLDDFKYTLSKILLDINELRFFHDHILYKTPGADATPWHHDRPYYLVDGPDNFSIWITPDLVKEDNSLAFICGSHVIPNEYTPVSFEDKNVMGNFDSLLELRDSDISLLSQRGIKIFRMSPGDAVIFNNKTLHRSLASSSSAIRTALSLRFVTKNSWLTKKFVNAAPPFHKMGMSYEEGDKCSDKWFPKYATFLGK